MSWPFGDMTPFSYDLIMADPPWSFENYSAPGEEKNPKAHYDCMTLADICALPVGQLAAGDCALWLWATHPMLPDALLVLRAWGFRFATSGVWVKQTPTGKLTFGTGYVLRSASEPFLIGVNGSPKFGASVRTVVEGVRREHSRKPDEAYDAALRLVPGAERRLDLFSRQRRPGWESWGAESDKFGEAAA